jgi:solute carrier family 15 (peptide/histidine transporter), member 3/4
MTKKLHDGNASAASNVTTWQGTCYLTPLIGAILADAYWGRYWTIATFSTIYFIVSYLAPICLGTLQLIKAPCKLRKLLLG